MQMIIVYRISKTNNRSILIGRIITLPAIYWVNIPEWGVSENNVGNDNISRVHKLQ